MSIGERKQGMRMRITVRPTGDRTNDLRIAANVRRELWARSPVEVDQEFPLHGAHRDRAGHVYFEFSTLLPDEVKQALSEAGHADQVDMQPVREALGQACQNCGNIAGPVLPTVCPNCQFRDISACPACQHEVPRQNYERIGGDFFCCPHCHSRIRLRFNEPMFLEDGAYNQPLIVVEQAEHHEVQV
jgi:hypothetical protein